MWSAVPKQTTRTQISQAQPSGWRCLRPILIGLFSVVLIGCGSEETNAAQTSSASADFEGVWRAVDPRAVGTGYIELSISKNENGELQADLTDQHHLTSEIWPNYSAAFTVDGRTATGRLGYFWAHLLGRLSSDPVDMRAELDPQNKSQMEVTFSVDGNDHDFTFFPSNSPQFQKFSHPRLDDDGAPVQQYTYRKPAENEELPVASAADMGVDPKPLEEFVNAVLSEDPVTPNMTSVLVIKDGKLVFEEYFRGHNAQKGHHLMSVTKSYTSLLLGSAIERELVSDADAPFSNHFKKEGAFAEYADTVWGRSNATFSILDLLRMADIVGWGEGDRGIPMFYTEDWTRTALDDSIVNPEPGDAFNYNSHYTYLVAEWVRRELGNPSMLRTLSEWLLEPMGVTQADWMVVPNADVPSIDVAPVIGLGGLILRSRDLAKTGEMVLGCGERNGVRVISCDWLVKSTAIASLSDPFGPELRRIGYSHAWWINRYIREEDGQSSVLGALSARGNGGQLIFVVPQYNAVIVTTAENYLRGAMFDEQIKRFFLPALDGTAMSRFEDDQFNEEDLGYSPLAADHERSDVN